MISFEKKLKTLAENDSSELTLFLPVYKLKETRAIFTDLVHVNFRSPLFGLFKLLNIMKIS